MPRIVCARAYARQCARFDKARAKRGGVARNTRALCAQMRERVTSCGRDAAALMLLITDTLRRFSMPRHSAIAAMLMPLR